MNIDSVTLDTHAHTDVDTEYNILARKKTGKRVETNPSGELAGNQLTGPTGDGSAFWGPFSHARPPNEKKKGKITSCVRAHPGLSSRPIENTPHIDSRQHPPTRHRRRSVGHLLLFNKELNAIIKKNECLK